MSKIVSGRTEWERSQQRLTQTAAARQVPPVAESKILFVASQIPNLSRQLANRNQLDHIRISFLRLAAIDGHTDTNAALVTCLLLRACFNALPCNTSEEKKLLLGSWHDWKVTADSLIPVLESLQWDHWIILTLPWLSDWIVLFPLILKAGTTDSLRMALVRLAARYLQTIFFNKAHMVLPTDPVVDSMIALEGFLLECSNADLDAATCVELRLLSHALNSALDATLANQADVECMDARFLPAISHLLARLSIQSPQKDTLGALQPQTTHPKPPHMTRGGHEPTETARSTSRWQWLLYCNKSPSTRPPEARHDEACDRDFVALMVVSVVSALFGDFSSFESEKESYDDDVTGLVARHHALPFVICADPNPVSPGRILWTALSMLSQIEPLSSSSSLPDCVGDQSLLCDNTIVWDRARRLLPEVCWRAAELVTNREQQNALLRCVLGPTTTKGDPHHYPDRSHARVEEKEKGQGPLSMLRSRVLSQDIQKEYPSFQEWAHKEIIALTNRLRTSRMEDVEVHGICRAARRTDAVVDAIFPAALLLPHELLQKLLEGATSQPGQAEMLYGVLLQLPALATAEVGEGVGGMPILAALLADRLKTSKYSLTEEYEKLALESCVLALAGVHQRHTITTRPEEVDKSKSRPTGGPPPHLQSVISADVLLVHVALPALLQYPDTAETALTVRIIRKLIAIDPDAFLLGLNVESQTPLPLSEDDNNSAALKTKEPVLLGERLLGHSLKTLDFSSRRIDLSSKGLHIPIDVLEEHSLLARICSTTLLRDPATAAAAARRLYDYGNGFGDAFLYLGTGDVQGPEGFDWQGTKLPISVVQRTLESKEATVRERACALCAVMQMQAVCEDCDFSTQGDYYRRRRGGSDTDRRLYSFFLREALIVSCAVIIPCCTSKESERIFKGVGFWINMYQEELEDVAPAALAGAVIEVACRALHALALIPGLVPIEDEEVFLDEMRAGPSNLRRIAVARFMNRTSGLCQRLVEGVVDEALRPALAARAVRDLSRCIAAINDHYDCDPLRVGLLHLVNILVVGVHNAGEGHMPPFATIAGQESAIQVFMSDALEFVRGSSLHAVITTALDSYSRNY